MSYGFACFFINCIPQYHNTETVITKTHIKIGILLFSSSAPVEIVLETSALDDEDRVVKEAKEMEMEKGVFEDKWGSVSHTAQELDSGQP